MAFSYLAFLFICCTILCNGEERIISVELSFRDNVGVVRVLVDDEAPLGTAIEDGLRRSSKEAISACASCHIDSCESASLDGTIADSLISQLVVHCTVEVSSRRCLCYLVTSGCNSKTFQNLRSGLSHAIDFVLARFL
jgi:hypothetical protein